MSDFGNDLMTSMNRVWHSDLRAQSSVNLSISMGIGSFENSGWCLCAASIDAAFPLLHLQGTYCVLSIGDRVVIFKR